MPSWVTLSGIAIGLVLFGVGLGLVIADQRGWGEPARPELHVKLLGANVFIPDQWPSVTGIGLQTRVWNTGALSIVTDWTLKVIPNGKQAVVAQLTEMPNVLTATGEISTGILRAEDSLEKKTRTAQVGITPVDGTLLFYIPLPRDVVRANDTTWELTAKDIYEKETAVSQLLGNWIGR